MRLFGLGNKIDYSILQYMNVTSRRKIPVIVCYKNNIKNVKSKILSNSGRIKYEYTLINAIACELTPSSVDKLSELPEVKFICFDYKAQLCLRKTHDIIGGSYLNRLNSTGKGIGIGIIDSGVYPHLDLISKRNSILYFKDTIDGYSKPYDDNGHGTFICGCIASSGHKSSGMYCGFAKDSNICMIKAFNACGNGYMSDIIYGIEDLISLKDKYNIKILCLPFEFPYLNKIKINPIEDIIDRALALNMTIVAPAGNIGGYSYSIYCPGNIKSAITVGGLYSSDNNIKNCRVTPFSGRGPLIDGTTKPDISLPCIDVVSLSSNTSYNPSIKNISEPKTLYTSRSGTSISCAIISSVCAVLLEKNPELTPRDLKSILCLSSISIGESKYSCGSGMFVFDRIVK